LLIDQAMSTASRNASCGEIDHQMLSLYPEDSLNQL
jgi:hypothetical protein